MTAQLPETDYSPLLRTDFTDDAAWQVLLERLGRDWMTVLADRGHQGLSVPELVGLVPEGSRYPVLVVADGRTFSADERSLLLIDVDEEPGRTVRVAPAAVPSVVGNLAIRNRTFDDYLDAVDGAGVYQLSDGHRRALAELQGHGRAGAPPGVARAAGPVRAARPSRRGSPVQPSIRRPGDAAEPPSPGTPPGH
ncbi:hypothetical protein FZ103_24500 [Streptomonospora sp. PA3]|uniref:DUF6924 domain-containing protein n=1 Tax=Streptomonospora sp. PA3 TaxID=2607326 RepID=UPI0012DCDC89|nr:hypothetical protein [Streptomonospora sp. PA3]MUL44282.1 hypothetical protein [Streptomonospora sp. PA3]